MRELIISASEELNRKRLLGEAAETAPEIEASVRSIIDAVAKNGDAALIDFTERFDKVKLTPETLIVKESEIKNAYGQVKPSAFEAIKLAISRIKAFHARQKQNSWMETGEAGVVIGQIISAVGKVGLYVPGGSAPLVSTVIMNAVPAIIAGVSELHLTTPPPANGEVEPALLVTADLLGIKNIYRIGGAQAVAALALGTETIPQVDKIVGPGNIYVATAKKQLFGQVGIDMIAGPSEILVIADESANPRFVASDLLSQAEHDPFSGCYLVTNSRALLEKVKEALDSQLKQLSRADIARKALAGQGLLILVDNLEIATAVSNVIAPEHLIIETSDPWSLLGLIKNAGAIFLGHFTPEAVGDYLAGPNHVLPTQGTARFFSPLGVEDFTKKSSLLAFNKKRLEEVSAPLFELTDIEGLSAHAHSVEVRLEKEEEE